MEFAIGLGNYFGFFFRRALEGETAFGFLTGFPGLLFSTTFTAAFFFDKTGFATGFTGFFGGAFLLGGAFFVATGFTGFLGGAFLFGGVFFVAIGFTGFFAGVLETDFTNGSFFTAFFAGFATGFVGFAAGLGFATGATLGGSFGAGGLLTGGTTGLISLTGGAAGVDAADCVEGGVAKMGEIQLRLTASRSIALNCDSNSGESGTS